MKAWSKFWKSSTKPGKQRKYRYNAPLHVKRKMVSSHLSKELRKKHNKRAVALVTGDKVKVERGQFKGHSGKIEKIDTKLGRIYVTGIEIQKKDGNKTTFSLDASNVIITELNLEDKNRNKILERVKNG